MRAARSLTGIAAIQQWHTPTKAKYHFTAEPLSVSTQAGAVEVIGKVAGDFPGSPIHLRYVFPSRGSQDRFPGDPLVQAVSYCEV